MARFGRQLWLRLSAPVYLFCSLSANLCLPFCKPLSSFQDTDAEGPLSVDL